MWSKLYDSAITLSVQLDSGIKASKCFHMSKSQALLTAFLLGVNGGSSTMLFTKSVVDEVLNICTKNKAFFHLHHFLKI